MSTELTNTFSSRGNLRKGQGLQGGRREKAGGGTTKTRSSKDHYSDEEPEEEEERGMFVGGSNTANASGRNKFKFQSLDLQILQKVRSGGTVGGGGGLAFLRGEEINQHHMEDEDFEGLNVNNSVFLTTLQDLQDLDLSHGFRSFLQRIGRLRVRSLVEVLFNKEAILEGLLNSIDLIFPSNENDPSVSSNAVTTVQQTKFGKDDTPLLHLPSMFKLLLSLYTDLQEELVPQIPASLDCLSRALGRPAINTEILSVGFQSLGGILRIVGGNVHVELIFEHLLPLLTSEKLHLSLFASECLSILMRKLRSTSLGNMVKFSLDLLQQKEEIAIKVKRRRNLPRALSLCYFNTIKQVEGGFHSRGGEVLLALLEGSFGKGSDAFNSPEVFEMLEKFFLIIANHGTDKTMEPLWDTLLKFIQLQGEEGSFEKLTLLLKLTTIWTGLKKGIRISNHKSLSSLLHFLFQKHFHQGNMEKKLEMLKVLLKVFTIFISSCTLDQYFSLVKPILSIITGNSDTAHLVFMFYDYTFKNWKGDGSAGQNLFTRLVMPEVIGFIETSWANNSQEECLAYMSLLFTYDDFNTFQIPQSLKGGGGGELIRFKCAKEFLKVFKSFNAEFFEDSRKLESGDLASRQERELEWVFKCTGVLDAFSRVDFKSLPWFDVMRDQLLILFEELGRAAFITSYETSNYSGDRRVVLFGLFGHFLGHLSGLSIRSGEQDRLLEIWDMIEKSLEMWSDVNQIIGAEAAKNFTTTSDFSGYFRGIAEYYQSIKRTAHASTYLSSQNFLRISALICQNLGSFYPFVRLYTLETLCAFEQVHYEANETGFEGPCNLFQNCLDLERVPNTFDNEREKPIHTRRIESIIQAGIIPHAIYKEGICRYILSLFSVNFAPLWPHASKALGACARKLSKTLWPIFRVLLLELSADPASPIPAFSVFNHVDFEMETAGDEEEENEEEEEEETTHHKQKESKSIKKKSQKPIVSFEDSAVNSFDASWSQTIVCLDPANSHRYIERFVKLEPLSVDFVNWYILMIKFMGEFPQFIVDESSIFIPLFLALFKDETLLTDNVDDDIEDEETVEVAPTKQNKQAKAKINAFLTSLSKVTKPRKLFKSPEVYSSLLQLVTNGDSRIQKTALDCIFTWQYSGLERYKDALKHLSDDETLREGLATFDMEEMRRTNDIKEQASIMQVTCRILYGKLITKHGRSSKAILRSRRLAIFGFLGTMTSEEREEVMQLMMEPFQQVLANQEEGGDQFSIHTLKSMRNVPSKKQLGFLNVVEDFVKQLRTMVLPNIPRIMCVLLNMIHFSENMLEGSAEGDLENYIIIQAKKIRLLSIKRLTLLFSIDVDFDFSPYINQIYLSFINSRIEKLETENTQAPSALLELVAAWSRDRRYLFYLAHNDTLIHSLLGLCSAKKVHESVTLHIISIIENIQDMHEEYPEMEFLPQLLQNDVSFLLEQAKQILTNASDTKQLRLSQESIHNRVIRILARISQFVSSSDVAEALLAILTPFLKSSSRVVLETTKTEILKILRHFLPLLPSMQEVHPSETSYYQICCQLFCLLESREARKELLLVFKVFAEFSSDLLRVYDHLENLNAMSVRRIDEPDFDRRFSAYSDINQKDYLNLTLFEWRPILYNFFYYIGDEKEFSIRTSAAFGVDRFIQVCSSSAASGDAEFDNLFNVVQHVIFPQIKKGLKVTDELVRNEWIKLWGLLITSLPLKEPFTDMRCLLGVDEENNFFANITHIQLHRRVKAIRQLALLVVEIKAANVTNLISILSHFIYTTDKNADHNIINEAMASLASCTAVLSWGQYYATIKRFLNSIKYRPELEKVLVRLIVLVLDKFHFSGNTNVKIFPEVAAVDDEEDQEEAVEEGSPTINNTSNDTNSQTERIFEAVTSKLIPSLRQLLAVKDDETLSVRTPLAVAIVKLLQQLPDATLQANLPKLLITLCNFLSSHLQSSRDSARSTLVTISTMLGPKYLSYIISSLKTALTRGYQLHVLGYTIHAIISENVVKYSVGSIDSCIQPLVAITMHDIFGETGKEREVQELKGKMREIKSTKSFETLEMLCKVMSFGQIQKVLLPLKEQMLETNDIKIVRQVEDIFKRLAVGLNQNPEIDMVNFMVFIHQLLTESLPLAQANSNKQKKLTDAEKRVRVQMKRSDAAITLKYYEMNIHLFVEFGLSLLLTSLRRDKIAPKNKEHMQMLDPLVANLGSGLYAKHANITVLSVRILSLIAKFPLPSLDESMPTIVKRLFQIIAKAGSTDTELIQAIFKLLTIILRECKHVVVPEKQVITLLSLLSPDLEDPEKQTTTFSLIRAVLERRYVTNEVYDLMDVVSRILVTSQSNQVRELCRHCYIQFLVEYPHGNARLRKQIGYLVSNLEYEFESGRVSVLELLNLAITKFSNEVFAEYADMLFLAIVMVLVNDDSAKSREMAGFLIKALFLRLEITRMQNPIVLIEKWFKSNESDLQKLSCQVFGLVIDAFGERCRAWVGEWIPRLQSSLILCLEDWREVQEGRGDDENENELMVVEQELVQWETTYFSLKTFSKILNVFTPLAVYECQEIWESITALLLHPHQWIRLLCAQILGQLFSHIDSKTRRIAGSLALQPQERKTSQPIPEGPYHILSTEADLRKLAKRFSNQLDSKYVSSDHAKQIVKNFYFIGKAMIPFLDGDVMEVENVKNQEDEEDEDEDEKEEEVERKSSSLLWFTKRMCFLARTDASKKRGIQLRTSVFQWFAAIYRYIPPEAGRLTFLRSMLQTLYYVEKDETFKGGDADTLKQLASEVMSLLQKETGTTAYVETYQSIQDHVHSLRRDRKTQRAIQAVTDPMGRAQERQRRSQLKQSGRKRKANEQAGMKLKQSHSSKLQRKI